MATYTDIALDLASGRVKIDESTNDALIIYDDEVILQDAAIRLKTQVGTVQRQGLDDFGWNYLDFIKAIQSDDIMSSMLSEITRVIMSDTRIEDAEVRVERTLDSVTVFADITIDGTIYPLTVNL